jgi:DNA (cytosine-5)-methyltransferase 1
MIEITSGDFLAGGGGVTEAMTQIPGLKVEWVLNHWSTAIRTNMHNHKKVKHYLADFYKQDEHEMKPVDFVWASIECTQHSRANGGREKKIGSYTLGFELIRYLKHLNPLVVGIENVPEFRDWSPLDDDGQPDKNRKGEEFERWKAAICAMGYDYHENINNAADFGIPTRRVRYFAFFTKSYLQMKVNWPQPTHSKKGGKGLEKWVACKNYIDLTNEGESIFGREYNENIKKQYRKPLVANSMKRFAGGIKKYSPELAFIFQYYGSGLNIQSLKSPLNTITTKDRHVLVTMEKMNFITDHCYADNYNAPDDPLNPILTRETKQLVTVEKNLMVQHYSGDHSSDITDPLPSITTIDHNQVVTARASFLADYYSRDNTAQSLDSPANTIRTENSKHLVSTSFISPQFGTGINHSIDSPLSAITAQEKIQFISLYFSSSGKQESQNQSIESPLNSITTGTNKQALITALETGDFDFDIRARFLTPDELAAISTFPDQYFTDPLLRLTKKEIVKLIGNAVPPKWAELMIKPVIEELQQILLKQQAS